MLGEAASLAGAEVGVPGYDPASRRSVEDLSNPIIQVRKDGRFHQCFCGRAGFISGTIKTYKNERLSVEAEVDRPNAPPSVRPQQSSKSADAALPTPAQSLPAKR
jgi:hypothetical protein